MYKIESRIEIKASWLVSLIRLLTDNAVSSFKPIVERKFQPFFNIINGVEPCNANKKIGNKQA
jgi:hypothetical protein